MKEAYVNYEIAKLLKEKGFDEYCFAFWEYELYEYSLYITGYPIINSELEKEMVDGCSAPTHQMAMAWLREKGIYITIIYGDYPANKKVFWTPQIDSLEGFDLPDSFYQEYNLYEDAVEAAIKYCLENLI